MHPTIQIYSRLARTGTVVVAALGLTVSGLIIWHDGLSVALSQLPWVWLVVVVVWFLWWSPLLIVRPDAIVARNFFTVVTVPWSVFEQAEANLGLVLCVEDGRRFRVSAAGPRGGLSRMRSRGLPQSLPHIDEDTPRLSLDLDTNQAMELLHDYLERFHGALSPAQVSLSEVAAVSRRPNWLGLVVLALMVVVVVLV